MLTRPKSSWLDHAGYGPQELVPPRRPPHSSTRPEAARRRDTGRVRYLRMADVEIFQTFHPLQFGKSLIGQQRVVRIQDSQLRETAKMCKPGSSHRCATNIEPAGLGELRPVEAQASSPVQLCKTSKIRIHEFVFETSNVKRFLKTPHQFFAQPRPQPGRTLSVANDNSASL